MRGRSGTGMPPALRNMSSSAVAREPEVKALDSGFDAGGGVRLHPPHLEEALGEAADAFTSATPRPSTTNGGGDSARSSCARPGTSG